ncbi:cbb3-type cytochrome oxidase assembly protein CcoS [Bernardetia sp.]|uniref:cbb3-type cytochrome oxidase assembly protein CcoS n=1 Tax=Bernardetia sp. TaxID=1937974 RepID=UPI0025BCBB76|nr:cbb3-type cytochrome oxidase assembly protein CcoS [Bernardetia sp.]
MQVLIILVVCSLVVALGFLAAFFWSVKDNQYEDTYTPSMRILFDDTYSDSETGENNTTEHLN